MQPNAYANFKRIICCRAFTKADDKSSPFLNKDTVESAVGSGNASRSSGFRSSSTFNPYLFSVDNDEEEENFDDV